ncbi:MAG: YegP family protein [Blastocatellales bacterium]
MAGKFQLTKTSDNKFHFNLVASNGQVILSSQTYESAAGAKNGIESVMTNAGEDANYERKTAADGRPYFTLLAANKQVIGQSQMYSSEDAMENGIQSVKNHAAGATLDDQTGA